MSSPWTENESTFRQRMDARRESYEVSRKMLLEYVPVEICEKILEEAGFLLPRKLLFNIL